jgi:hypothetical protein
MSLGEAQTSRRSAPTERITAEQYRTLVQFSLTFEKRLDPVNGADSTDE